MRLLKPMNQAQRERERKKERKRGQVAMVRWENLKAKLRVTEREMKKEFETRRENGYGLKLD